MGAMQSWPSRSEHIITLQYLEQRWTPAVEHVYPQSSTKRIAKETLDFIKNISFQ